MIKKYFMMALCAGLFSLGLVSCDVETDESAGGTAIQDMAGFWDVEVYTLDATGNRVSDLGSASIRTYNTAANTDNEFWLTDDGNVFNFKYKLPINYAAKTFSGTAQNVAVGTASAPAAGDGTITDGKVLLGEGHNLHGNPTDSIAFKIQVVGDNTVYQLVGTRHSGFKE